MAFSTHAHAHIHSPTFFGEWNALIKIGKEYEIDDDDDDDDEESVSINKKRKEESV